MNILVVEDNETNLKLLRTLLVAEGHRVFTASDGEVALAILGCEPVEAIISDILMPRMDGYRLCHEVRTNPRFSHLPFILYSATYVSANDQKLGWELGADKFLRKPAPPGVIVEAFQEIMKAQRRRPEQIKPPRELNLMKEYNTQLVAKLEEKYTELRAQATVLNQSVSHKQAILDSALDCIIAIDHEGRIVEFNPAAERTFGFTRTEALGQAMDGLIIPPALRERYRLGLAHCLATGEGSALEKRLELSALRKDGVEFPIELTAARISGMEPPMFTAFVRDITERKREEEARMAAEAKFRRLVEQSITGIYVIQDDKFAYVNPKMAEIFGCSQEELTSMPVLSFIFEEDRALVCESIRRRLQLTSESIHYTLRALRKDGTLIHVEAHGGQTEYNGRPAILGSLLDITERKQAEKQMQGMQEQLQQTNRDLVKRNEEIQYFYHTLSHELKTPLTSAREFVSIVMDGLGGEVNETQLSYLRIAKESCTQLAVYINDLLDATRLDTGKLRVELKPVSLLAVVQRAMTIMKPAAAGKNILLSEEFDTHVTEVMVDESRIVQILTNLLNNALKFTPEGGSIAMKLGQDPKRPERVLISVKDTGCGIPKHQLKNIFRRFYQIKQGDHTPEKGVGLGLYLCRELVLLHGGTISVESEPGKGSSFSFSIPKDGIKKGAHVLIVDDDEGVRESLRLVVEKHNFEVTTVGGGSEALQAMSLNAPDVVVLDLVMDGLDGTSTLEEIRKNWGLIPVIVYTGHPDSEFMQRAMKFSPFTLLAKPCPPKRFVETVRRMCHTSDTRFLKKQANACEAAAVQSP